MKVLPRQTPPKALRHRIIAGLLIVLLLGGLVVPATASAAPVSDSARMSIAGSGASMSSDTGPSPTDASATAEPPRGPTNLTARYAMLISGRASPDGTPEVLFEKSADAKVYPASTTKIMTALLALEKGDLLDMVVCTTDVIQADPSSAQIGLNVGETLSLEDLLYGLLLPSGNDCAMAVAVHIGGSVKGFVEMMNARAAELGMTGTHFANPHGLHNADHYTTARDMATLTLTAMSNPIFQKIVGTAEHTIPATNMSVARPFVTTNSILGVNQNSNLAYQGCVGVKTGATAEAGGCLVAAAERDNTKLICVVYQDTSSQRWGSATTMFEFGFSKYRTVDLAAELERTPVMTKLAGVAKDDLLEGELQLEAQLDEPYYFMGTREDVEALLANMESIQATFEPPLATLRAPVTAGQVVGTVSYSQNGRWLLTANLVATRDVAAYKSPFSPNVGTEKKQWPLWWVSPVQWTAAVIALCSAVALVLLFLIRRTRRKRLRIKKPVRRI